MSKFTPRSSKSWILAAALTAGVAAPVLFSSSVVRADDSSDKMSQCVTTEMDKAKKMAADPQQMTDLKKMMAKQMVMDKMAMMMAKDPQCDATIKSAMQDPDLMKTHDAAKEMAKDPEQMNMLKQEIMDDPKAMGDVVHHAAMMAMMKDKMGDMGGSMMDKGSKMMGDTSGPK